MYISNETVDQTEKRLKKVIQTADFRIFDKSYYFKEVPVTNFEFETEALAISKRPRCLEFFNTISKYRV